MAQDNRNGDEVVATASVDLDESTQLLRCPAEWCRVVTFERGVAGSLWGVCPACASNGVKEIPDTGRRER